MDSSNEPTLNDPAPRDPAPHDPAPHEIVITAQALTDLVTEIFEQTSCSSQESQRIAANLVEANLTGHDSHGVVRVPRYVDWLAAGVQLPDQQLAIVIDEPTLMLVDGQYGMGQTVGPLAVNLGIERATEHGLAIVALRKAGHLGRIGAFVEQAAAAGLVSMHIVNVASSQLVAPFGSRDRRMGTNPYAFGVPRPDGLPPIVHDFANVDRCRGQDDGGVARRPRSSRQCTRRTRRHHWRPFGAVRHPARQTAERQRRTWSPAGDGRTQGIWPQRHV